MLKKKYTVYSKTHEPGKLITMLVDRFGKKYARVLLPDKTRVDIPWYYVTRAESRNRVIRFIYKRAGIELPDKMHVLEYELHAASFEVKQARHAMKMQKVLRSKKRMREFEKKSVNHFNL